MNLPSRLYAALIAHHTRRYHTRLAPFKRTLLAGIRGVVLEIGPGAGANLPFLSPLITYLGIEPNDYLRGKSQYLAYELKFERATFIGGSAEYISHYPDDEVDVAISTFVLCTVPRPAKVLDEIYRVLKPGGRLVFLEHVAAPHGTFKHFLQRILTPLSRRCAGGCELNRETVSVIRKSGFSSIVTACSPRIGWRPLGPLVAGSAFKS